MISSDSTIQKPLFFQECIDDLNLRRDQLTKTEMRYACDTILAIEILFDKREEISTILNEDERNAWITRMTRLYAEPGLVPGSTSAQIQKSILARVDLLKTAFLFDRAKNETFLLYKQGFIGPPCFNGRVITLQYYVFQRQGIKSELFYEYTTHLDSVAAKLEEIMYICAAHLELKDGKVPTLRQIQEFALLTPDIFKKHELEVDREDFPAIYQRSCQFYVE